MISFETFKIFIYVIFGIAWASVIFITISGIKDIGKWFSSGGKAPEKQE